jgi:hypothetical protein
MGVTEPAELPTILVRTMLLRAPRSFAIGATNAGHRMPKMVSAANEAAGARSH